ncbi:macro domain-containing protein [Fervidobacterium sp. 2310opik-2]|uniref:macro domain-containing protein n=1 Tax=Fervidobacterium sp. 2310opik-2 TaxID=1755815 RepID=UPI0013E00008|nr:macro domain-containing protein [Fervidobacterium sp. 2310opik-2]KAF2961041.1 hypothetical protein AS161_03440 [Fervidobacterium sp. 2310opik-2]
MIILSPYSVFEHLGEVEAVVNTINTKGYMGKGLALEFALRFPEMESEYKKLCQQGKIKPGDVWEYESEASYYKSINPLERGKKKIRIYNVATKDDFKFPSKIEWIESGVIKLREKIVNSNVKSIAIPKLGAGLGKLDWESVESIIVEHLYSLDCRIIVTLDYKKGPLEEFALKEALKEISNASLFGISEIKEVSRFRDLMNIENIGKKKYSDLVRRYF